jgi:hypothetical protein
LLKETHAEEIRSGPEFCREIAEAEEIAKKIRSAQPVKKDSPLSFGTCVAGAVAVFTIGSVASVLGASTAFSFPLYTYFEPVDYLRTAPIWGVVIAVAFIDHIFAIALKYFAKETNIPMSDRVLRRQARRYTLVALLFLSLTVLWAVTFLVAPKEWRVAAGSSIVFFTYFTLENVRVRLSMEHFYPRHWEGVRRAFLEVAPLIIVSAYLAGLFWLRPQVEVSNPVVVHLKGEKQEQVHGKIVYVLDKFVIVEMMSDSDGPPCLSAINCSEISRIEHLPVPKPVPSPTHAPKA